MIRTIFVSLFIMVAVSVSAQTKRYYCEVKGVEKELTSGLKIVFDFGNNPVYSAWGGLKSKQKLVDEKGEGSEGQVPDPAGAEGQSLTQSAFDPEDYVFAMQI